jgi:hypothetical protein
MKEISFRGVDDKYPQTRYSEGDYSVLRKMP